MIHHVILLLKFGTILGMRKCHHIRLVFDQLRERNTKLWTMKRKKSKRLEESKAFFQVYEGAVYLNQGKTYLVTSLDLSRKIAWCKESDLKYYTKIIDSTDIHVVGGNVAYPAPAKLSSQFSRTTARADPCRVTTNACAPKYSYASQAVWVPVPPSIIEAVMDKNLDYRAGLHAASHAVLHVVPLRIICNLSDLAPECADPHKSNFLKRILLYDQHPGGTGVSLQVQPIFMELLTAALELLTSCHCAGDLGCPNCIQSFACKAYNEGCTQGCSNYDH
ncbi:hypothetical protein M0R45_023411 [Rubus argutus]|uniref:MrfA-like Zn-binding domain-containing protein n=1 Tax=Rubus argutus TaxID=59490 RepID=A0AAW1WQ93_RUBAR